MSILETHNAKIIVDRKFLRCVADARCEIATYCSCAAQFRGLCNPLQEQLGQAGAILTGDSGDQRDFIGIFPSSSVTHRQTLRPNFFSSSASEI